MLLNVVNNFTCADFDTIKADGSINCLRCLAIRFILMINHNFTAWMDKTGEGSHLHWILFQYLDNCYVCAVEIPL
jgi:hypothetical protein